MAGTRELTGWLGVVLDAPDAQDLARFYRDLLGWPLADDEPGWCSATISRSMMFGSCSTQRATPSASTSTGDIVGQYVVNGVFVR
ncbi:VOC family protein [Flexivirga sp.]|uniref:VOC family protein n=1 Tax=Flexivirga sp. TaxID=1962927 RepID=UPI003F80ED08